MPTETRPLCEIDVLDRSFYLDPHPGYTHLRTTTPLSWDERRGLWVLTKHEDISYVSTHPDLFCSGEGVRPTQSIDLSIIGLDGERHIRQRRLLNQGFSPRMIRAMEDRGPPGGHRGARRDRRPRGRATSWPTSPSRSLWWSSPN